MGCTEQGFHCAARSHAPICPQEIKMQQLAELKDFAAELKKLAA